MNMWKLLAVYVLFIVYCSFKFEVMLIEYILWSMVHVALLARSLPKCTQTNTNTHSSTHTIATVNCQCDMVLPHSTHTHIAQAHFPHTKHIKS